MRKKIIITVLVLGLLFPSYVLADESECCKKHTCECNASQCGEADDTANAKNGLRLNNGEYYVLIDGQDYKAYCIDPGSAQGAGCATTCSPLPNDTFGQAFRNLLATATGTKDDQTALRVLGMLTGYTRETTKASLVALYGDVEKEVDGTITKNHEQYLRAYEALYGISPESNGGGSGATNNKPEDTSKPSKVTFKAVSSANGQITIQVTSSKKINKMKFKVEGGEMVGTPSWNGEHGTIVVYDSDSDCNIGITAIFNAANALICQRDGSQQFIVDTSMDKNGNAVEPGTYVTELIGDDEGESEDFGLDMAMTTYSITSDDYKKLDNAYYETTCKGKNECPPVQELDQVLKNCCEDGGYADVTEPELNGLFCKDENLGVEYFKKRIGSDKYIKSNATFADGDATVNGLAKKYCTVYCTQRAYIQIPGQPNTGKNGLYFELKKGDWGTASAYIKGTKRCRVRVDYDAWWKQYNEYLEEEIKAYNNFMENQAIYRYIDDNGDGIHGKINDTDAHAVDNLYVYIDAKRDFQRTCSYNFQYDTQIKKTTYDTCTYYFNITGDSSKLIGYPMKDTVQYSFEELLTSEPYTFRKVEWDTDLKDEKYSYVKIKNDLAGDSINASSIYTNDSIAPAWVGEKIIQRTLIADHYRNSTPNYTINNDCSGACQPDMSFPHWVVEESAPLAIEKYSNTDWSSNSNTPWVDVKNKYKAAAERASSDFEKATTDARDMERALDACNSYFLNETKNYTNLSVGGNNGYDAKKNYKLNSTYAFDYTQIYLDPMGELQEFVTNIPFGPAKGTSCYYTYDTAHSYDEYPGEAIDGNRQDMDKSYYSTKKYSKYGAGQIERYDDFSSLAKGNFVVEDEDGTYYKRNQTNTWYQQFLHKKVGELKEEVFTNDKRFNLDGLYKMECMWDETSTTVQTFVPNGSSNTLTREGNVTSHSMQYNIFLTTLEGSYDTNHHIGCIGENCVFDDIVANGDACARDGGSRKKSSEDAGESAMSCSIHIDYSITLTGICHPNDITAQIPDCELFGNDYNLFEFKIADAKDVLPNLKSGSYDYADNWFDDNGSKAKEQIETDGNNDKTYSPDHLTYSFVLTPTIMRDIKAYDKEATIDGGYTDFMMTCQCDDGACHKCTSSFLTELNNGTYGEVKPNETWGNSKQSLQNIRSNNEHVHWKGAK